MAAYLKLLGKSDRRVPDAWTFERPELLQAVRFGGDTPPADVAKEDRLVYYAIGWERFFAVAEVTSTGPYEAPVSHQWEAQWPWAVDIRIICKVRRLNEAPSVLELGSTPDRRHKGYVPLASGQADRAVEILG